MLSRSSTFFKLFPPPALLDVPCTGLHISEDAVRAVTLKRTGTTHMVTSYGERKLPKGTVEAGVITNANVLAQEIKALREKLKFTKVRVSLPEERMYLFSIPTPSITDIAARDVVESKLEENIPIAPAEAVYEFDPSERKNNLITKISVSAFSEKLIQSYIACCTLAGLEVRGFDTEPRALIRALALSPAEECIVVDISSTSTSMFIIERGIAQFSSTSAIGIEAEGSLEQEIQKIISYWKTKNEKSDIKKIIILGSSANKPSLIQHLEAALQMHVSLGNVWAGSLDKEKVPPIEFEQALDYGVAIGLALNQ